MRKIAPERDILVETAVPDEELPGWKATWDRAREFARAGRLTAAEQYYRRLLQEKPNIVEARWEFCKLLMQLEKWQEAAVVVEGLIELEPDNPEYLVAAGNTALENGHYGRAVRYFGQVYEMGSSPTSTDQAVAGLIQGYLKLGRKKGAFLLLEQKFQNGKVDRDTLEKLAALSEQLGIERKARNYYRILVDTFPTNTHYLAKAAEVHDVEGQRDKAARYWRKYLELEPLYLPFHRKLAEYYLSIDDPESALRHLKKIYAQDYLSTSLALRIAEIYDERLDRPDKALLYYEQYGNVFPEDARVTSRVEEIRRRLAAQYLPIVENGAEGSLWQDLELVTQDKSAIFSAMAEMLASRNKPEQEMAVLRLLYKEGAADPYQVQRLADLYLAGGYGSQAYALLLHLQKIGFEETGYFLQKARLERQFGEEQKALSSYLEYFGHGHSDDQALQEALSLAGELGLPAKLEQVWGFVPRQKRFSSAGLDVALSYIEGLRKNAFFAQTAPIYDKLLEISQLSPQERAEILFHKADTLYRKENIFEAEQLVREVLAKGWDTNGSLARLTDFSLRQNRTLQAEYWLAALARRYQIDDIAEREADLPKELLFLKAELLLAQQRYGETVELLAQNIDELGRTAPPQAVARARLYQQRALFLDGEYERCLESLGESAGAVFFSDERQVLQRLARQRTTSHQSAGTAPAQAGAGGGAGFSSTLARARYFRNYGEPQEALVLTERALTLIPGSVRGRLEKLEILSELTRYEQAIAVADSLPAPIQEQDYLEKTRLRLEFKSGKFDRIVEKVEMVESQPPQGEIAVESGTDESMYFWKKLLLARALWAANREEEAIMVYDALLTAPVNTLFLQKMEVAKVNFHLPPLKKSFWNVLPFSQQQEDPMAAVMDPRFAAQNIGQPVDEIAASLYGKYRWQKLIEQELTARMAIREKDYHRAEKEYLELMKEDRSQETLFDLATIYDKLGLYGKAAEIYERMKEEGPLYPGLDEYIEANVLKRQPRIATLFENGKKIGRDDYINLKKRSYGLEGWLMPSYDQEVSIRYLRNSYASKDRSQRAWSDRILGQYSTYFENTIDLNMSFGFDIPTDSGTKELLYKFELIRRINKALEIYGRFEQDLVEDNMNSVLQSIISRDLETGMKFDIFPRWFVGADYRYRMYSDDNMQHRYKLWSMYHLFGEVNQFKVKYSYEHIRNNDENVGVSLYDARNQAVSEDRLYWSPEQYWQHLFTIHFKHFFDDKGVNEGPLSFFSLDYSYGYESEDNQTHAVDLNIFLEINRHFLLKGNFNNQNGDDYEETKAAFSLIYRW